MALILEIILGIGIVAIGALISGTILWLIWPMAIPAAFPGLIANGAISAHLSWWASVCLCWVFGMLIKSSNTNNNKKK